MHLKLDLSKIDLDIDNYYGLEKIVKWEKVVQKLGISFLWSEQIPQTDYIIFWNCFNVPTSLPPYLKKANEYAESFIGNGLTPAEAQIIMKGEALAKNEASQDNQNAAE